jgi:hypothetical protein
LNEFISVFKHPVFSEPQRLRNFVDEMKSGLLHHKYHQNAANNPNPDQQHPAKVE